MNIKTIAFITLAGASLAAYVAYKITVNLDPVWTVSLIFSVLCVAPISFSILNSKTY